MLITFFQVKSLYADNIFPELYDGKRLYVGERLNISINPEYNGKDAKIFIFDISDGRWLYIADSKITNNIINFRIEKEYLYSRIKIVVDNSSYFSGRVHFILNKQCQTEDEDSNNPIQLSNSNITIYPNPSSDILYFQSEKIFEKYYIYSSDSKLLLEGNINSNGILIDKLNSGVYFLRLINGTENNYLMFVKN